MDDPRLMPLSARRSRRTALRAGAAGLPTALLTNRVAAQEATANAEREQFLFVQNFSTGTLAPNEGSEGTYTLTLAGGMGWTLYFTDRPARRAGVTPTADFLAELAASQDDPLNAALVGGAGR